MVIEITKLTKGSRVSFVDFRPGLGATPGAMNSRESDGKRRKVVRYSRCKPGVAPSLFNLNLFSPLAIVERDQSWE